MRVARRRCSRMHSLLLSFSLLLATVAQGGGSPAESAALDHLLQLAASSSCAQSGQIVCNRACDQLAMCQPNDEGGFEEVTLEMCSAGTRCSAELHRCADRPTACGASTESGIACHSAGRFPDPLNCSVYHDCSEEGAVSTPGVCDPGYAYNALTSDCSYRTTDSVCTDGPTPPCIREGQSGAVATNPNIYYVCTNNDNILVPDLYKCDNGLVYDPGTNTCVDSTSTTTPVTRA
ncbi:uncharacterized protein LOC126239719 isoform X1 [Schistocerca nitens]|uniref:uncharacterized protein LOC126239719 isoform X1 n=1 Tax=Schistocerca nitens TaxID=7011 RepID=UPI00211851A4|nr:uncharacterized protein LOC126239719 isoform X1 [Schistocerca nitens]